MNFWQHIKGFGPFKERILFLPGHVAICGQFNLLFHFGNNNLEVGKLRKTDSLLLSVRFFNKLKLTWRKYSASLQNGLSCSKRVWQFISEK